MVPRLKDILVDGYINEESWEYFENSWKTLADTGANGEEMLCAYFGEFDLIDAAK